MTPDEVSHQKASVNSMYSSLSLFEIVATGDNLWLLIRSAADSYILSSTAHVACSSHLLEIFHAFFSILFFHFKSMLASSEDLRMGVFAHVKTENMGCSTEMLHFYCRLTNHFLFSYGD